MIAKAVDMAPGSTVRDRDGDVWTAGDPSDTWRWMHQDGERQVTNATVQRWLDDDKVMVLR
jgi:hypothetical protein